MILLILSSLLTDFERVIHKGVFVSTFVETLQAGGTRIEFKGKMYLRMDGFRIEVLEPEKQVIIGRGSNVDLYLENEADPIKTEMAFTIDKIFFDKERFRRIEKGSLLTIIPVDSIGLDSARIYFRAGFPRKMRLFAGKQVFWFVFNSPTIKRNINIYNPPQWKGSRKE